MRRLLLLHVASGAVALGLETAWARAMTLAVGGGLERAPLGLAFMAGMAIGAAFGAQLPSFRRGPSRLRPTRRRGFS